MSNDAKGPHFLASAFIQTTTQWTLQGDDKGVPGITFYGDDSPYLAIHFVDFAQLERLIQDLTSFLRSQPPRVEVAALTDEQMEAAKAGFSVQYEMGKLAGEEARRVDAASEITDADGGVVDGEEGS